MRLWSIHPKYLDVKGLLGLWRESLLAKTVLLGKCKAYYHHPQLYRFLNTCNPIIYINLYLKYIYKESKQRKYSFNKKKIDFFDDINYKKINITNDQLTYELNHLKKKLKKRSIINFNYLINIHNKNIEANPIFNIINGNIEKWEKIY